MFDDTGDDLTIGSALMLFRFFVVSCPRSLFHDSKMLRKLEVESEHIQ